MTYECFAVDCQDGIARVRMNRPDKANSMIPAFWRELPALTRDLDASGATRVMILSGEGRHFCSGMDLAAFAGINGLGKGAEPGRARLALRELILALQDAFTALEQARFPVIAAIHGGCIGGAVDMVTACDLRYASADAWFAIEEVNIGMTADVGTLQRLPKLVPGGLMREWAYTGRRIPAGEALEAGLVERVHDDRDALIAGVESIARQIAARSPLAVAGTKAMITYARDHSVRDGLDAMASWNMGALHAPDMMTAMQARTTKTDPRFPDLLPLSRGLAQD